MIKVSEQAKQEVYKLMEAEGFDSINDYVRVGVKSGGCSGLSYNMEFVDSPDKNDEVLNIEDIKIYIDPKATLFLLGTTMDYEEGELESGFKFINPNEKGRCGCGESFHV